MTFVASLMNAILRNYIAILPQSDAKLGQRIVLVIEGDRLPETQLAKLTTLLREQLSKFHFPKKILFIPQFFRLPNRKMNRKMMIQWLAKLDGDQ